jgi:hypothetical protein
MGQWISGQLDGQLRRCGNQAFKRRPCNRDLHCILQWVLVAMGLEQSRAESGKPLQCVMHRRFSISHTGITAGLDLTPCLANDPIMRFDDDISNRAAPFQCTDCQNGQSAVPRDIARITGEVSSTLTRRRVTRCGGTSPNMATPTSRHCRDSSLSSKRFMSAEV